jgi:hypothetical protein
MRGRLSTPARLLVVFAVGLAATACEPPEVESDAGEIDAGPADVALPDASVPDAGTFDAGVHDAGVRDAGLLDAGTPDAGLPDAGRPDAGVSSDAGLEVFITSMWWGGNLGGRTGVAGADFNCQLAAEAGMRGGTWKAFLGDSTHSAESRITAAGPWSQSFEDGGVELVFASVPTATTLPLHPIRVNEQHSTAFYYAPALYWTGNTTGGPVPTSTTCGDYTEGYALTATTGVANSPASAWVDTGTKPCYWFNALLCFQESASPPPQALGTAHKRAFVTHAAYTGDLGGLTGADRKCNDAALDGGLSGHFIAYLGTADAGPATRFPSGGPWYQHMADGGVRLTFNNAANVANSPRAPLRSDEHGHDRGAVGCSQNECLYWTGAVGAFEPGSWSCADWTTSVLSNQTTPIGSPTADDPKWTNAQWESCSYPHALVCLEQ